MKKKLLFSLAGIILLACSLISPPATPAAQADRRLTTPPGPDESAPTATLEITVPSVTDTATPTQEESECDQLNLTPEECAALGTHQYDVHGAVTGDCRYGNEKTTREDTITITFSFAENKLSEPEGGRWGCPELTRIDKNSFAAECNFPATSYSTEAGFSLTQNVSFNDGGFVETRKESWVDKVSGGTMICDWTETYELIE